MQIDIQTSRLTLSAEQRAQIRRRAAFALARLQPRIERVEVRLADINGSRGGIDKQCRVMVHLSRGPSAVVEDLDGDLMTLVDRSLARVGRVAAKRVQRDTQPQYLPRASIALLALSEAR